MNAVTESLMNGTPEIEMPTPLVFTDNAAKKVKELIDEEGSPDLKQIGRASCRERVCNGV